MTPRFTISILCHNRLELTQACLRSVSVHSRDCELIITDNGSTDGTPAYLANYAAVNAPHVHLVTNPTNLGFIAPNNHALTLARGEFFVTLNNDMTVCEGWLEKLAAPFEHNPKLAITGIKDTCTTISEKLIGTKGARLDYIEGSCLMIPTALARRHGLFSPYLNFAYWEDTDLSLRMREMGYSIQTVALSMNHNSRGNTSSTVPGIGEHLRRNTEEMKRRFGFYLKRHTLDRRILVRRLGAHGDVLLTTPVLRALRDRYPQAHIHVLTKCPTMLHGLDWLSVATRARNWYDEFLDLDLAYEKRPEVHIVQAFADKLGVKLPPRWQLHMHANEADITWAMRVTRGEKVALLHPGPTCWPGKNWPLDRFKEVARALQDKGYFTVNVGAEDAPDTEASLNLAGRTTPQQLYALARHAHLFVGIDSMPQHVASAADCPSVVLFGPTNPRVIVRPTPRIVAVQVSTDVAPCAGAHGRRTKAVTQSPCDGACSLAITVMMVLKAVERVERITAI